MLSEFHDGRLVGIVLLARERCAVFLRKVDGSVDRILLEGVEALWVDDLRQGNIVLNVTARTGVDVDAEELCSVLHMMSVDAHRAAVDRIVARIRNGELTFFQISPSYGASVECLCAGWHVQPVPDGAVMSSETLA